MLNISSNRFQYSSIKFQSSQMSRSTHVDVAESSVVAETPTTTATVTSAEIHKEKDVEQVTLTIQSNQSILEFCKKYYLTIFTFFIYY